MYAESLVCFPGHIQLWCPEALAGKHTQLLGGRARPPESDAEWRSQDSNSALQGIKVPTFLRYKIFTPRLRRLGEGYSTKKSGDTSRWWYILCVSVSVLGGKRGDKGRIKRDGMGWILSHYMHACTFQLKNKRNIGSYTKSYWIISPALTHYSEPGSCCTAQAGLKHTM